MENIECNKESEISSEMDIPSERPTVENLPLTNYSGEIRVISVDLRKKIPHHERALTGRIFPKKLL